LGDFFQIERRESSRHCCAWPLSGCRSPLRPYAVSAMPACDAERAELMSPD
jgi:hypothetical protein